MKRTSVMLLDDVHRAMCEDAADRGISVTRWVREAIEAGLRERRLELILADVPPSGRDQA